ncbi:MAG: M20 family metallopeptidase [Candidatus Omnitrophota bacterium]
MINKKRLISLTRRLIKINSENPPGNEFEIACFVRDYLKALGLSPRIYEFKSRRSNVVAVLEGINRQRSLLISPHLDTVPAGANWKFDPFAGEIKKGRIYGLGATDCKGNLACALEAINSIVEDNITLGYNLIFAATADEESGSDLGLQPLLNKKILQPDAALVLDADNFEIIITQKGLIHLKLKIQGRKAHGAYPEQGINAIDIALDIIKEIKAHKFSSPGNRYLKPPTINIGTIKGGDKVNVVADWCEFELDFRFLPGMSAKYFLSILKGITDRRIKKTSRPGKALQGKAKIQIEIEGIQEPYYISKEYPLVACLKGAMHKAGGRPAIRGSEGATVMTFFQHKNIPAVACGFGSEGCAHIADEYAEIDNLYRGATALEIFLKNYRFQNDNRQSINQ